MVLGRSHRAQMSFPIHFTGPDHGKTYIGETIEISSTGFSVQVKTEHPLPPIILAGILPSRVAGDAILCKARVVWQGGILRGTGRASYKIISIAQKSQERLDQLIRRSLDELIDRLSVFPVFQECERADMEALLGLARTREICAGIPLYEAGRIEGTGVTILLDGSVEVAAGVKAPLTFGPGSVIGRWSAPEPTALDETATAATDLRCLFLAVEILPELQRRIPAIAAVLYEALGQVPPRVPIHPAAHHRQLARLQLPRDLQEIPTLPSIFNAVMDCVESADATPRELAGILRMDQSLSAKILKTVNSALYSFPRRILSVHDAVELLGMQQTASLAITAMLLNTLVDDTDRDRRPEEFWEHSLGSAYFTQMIARRLMHAARAPAAAEAGVLAARADRAANPAAAGSAEWMSATAGNADPVEKTSAGAAGPAPAGAGGDVERRLPAALVNGRRTGRIDQLDRLFTYAILHDIGLLVLFLKFPDHFSMVRDAISQRGELHRAELDLLEIDHCQLGYRVAKAWHLPEPIPTIIAEHHLPQVWSRQLTDRDELIALLREEPVVSLISLADLLTRRVGIGVALDSEPPEIPEAMITALDLTAEDVAGWLAKGPAVREKTEHFFSGMGA